MICFEYVLKYAFINRNIAKYIGHVFLLYLSTL
jgi:hypothetical protein